MVITAAIAALSWVKPEKERDEDCFESTKSGRERERESSGSAGLREELHGAVRSRDHHGLWPQQQQGVGAVILIGEVMDVSWSGLGTQSHREWL